MQRNIKSDALVIRTRRVGDYHKSITCLTPRLGLIDALVYGAYKGKSKLSGITDSFSCLYIHFYHNPAKKSYKVTDAEELQLFPSLRNNLSRYYRASLFSEIVLKSCGGGGDSEKLFSLILESFSILNTCPLKKIDFVVIQFIWRFLTFSGINPDVNTCSGCGASIAPGEILILMPEENVFVCRKCAVSRSFQLNGGERKYLDYTSGLDFKAAVEIGLQNSSAQSLKRILLFMIQNFLEFPLNTLKNKDI